MKTSTVLYLSLSRPLDREIGLPVGQEPVAAVGAHCTNPSGDVKRCCRAGSGSPVHFSSNLPIIAWLCGLGKRPWVCKLIGFFRVSWGEKIIEMQTLATYFQTNVSSLLRVWALTFERDVNSIAATMLS